MTRFPHYRSTNSRERGGGEGVCCCVVVVLFKVQGEGGRGREMAGWARKAARREGERKQIEVLTLLGFEKKVNSYLLKRATGSGVRSCTEYRRLCATM